MSQQIDPTTWFTRAQSDGRYSKRTQLPLPPTGLSLSSSSLVQTAQETHAVLNLALTPPATPAWSVATQYVQGYAFTYSYVTSGTITRTVNLPFNPSNIYALDGIPPGVALTVSAATVDFIGQSSGSSAVLAVTAPKDSVAPAARTLAAGPSANGALITLDALNTEPDFAYYELWRGQGTSPATVSFGTSPVLTFNALSVEDKAIPATAANYFYKVISKDFSGNAATSNLYGALSLTTSAQAAPGAPNIAGSTITPNNDGSITLSWPGVSATGLSGYSVWRRIHGSTQWIQIASVSAASGIGQSYIDSQTQAGVQYDYTLTAFTSVGNQSVFPATFLTATALPSTVLPFAPGAIAVTGRLGGAYVVWTVLGSPSPAFYGVSYRLNALSAYSTEVRVNANQFTLQGLVQLREQLANNLQIKVVAYNADGVMASVPSTYLVTFPDLAGYTPADATIPAAPATVSVTKNDDGSVLLGWPASISVDRSGYQVEKYESLTVPGFHIQTSGGTSTLKYFTTLTAGSTGVSYQVTLWVQNLGIAPVQIGANVGEGPIVLPGQRELVNFSVTAVNNTTQVQLRFETLNVADNVNLVAYQPSVIRSSDGAQLVPVTATGFLTGWVTFSGSTLLPGGQPPSQNILINDFWDIEGTLQDDGPAGKTFRIGALEPFSYRGKQYRFRVRTQDYSGNISSINLVEDPSFESGTLNSWVVMADAGAAATVAATSPNSGSFSLAANQAARPSETVSVSGSLFYSFSAFMASNGNTTPLIALRIEWYTSAGSASAIRASDTSIGVHPAAGYQRLTLSVAAPADAAFARIYLYGDANNPTISVLWDDVQFEQAAAATAFNTTATAFINAIDQVAPQDYASVNGVNLLNLTVTGGLGVNSLRWTLPPSSFSGAFDYIDSVFEIWRQVTVSAQPGLAVDAAARKISEVRGGMGPAVGSAFLNFDDLDPSETFKITAAYSLKARDRFGNTSGFLNGGVAVTTTSLTPNDIQVARKDGLAPTAPVVSASTGATANTNGTITLSWTGSSTSGRNDLAGYHIYRQLNGAGNYVAYGDVFTTAEGGAQSWVDTGLDIGTTSYNYKVSAFDTALEESIFSGASNAVTAIDNRTPSPPSNIQVKGSVGGIQLAWTASTTPGVTKYKITIPDIAGEGVLTQDIVGSAGFIRLPGGPSAAAAQASAFYTAITVQAYSVSLGALSATASPANIVPDSNGVGNTWLLNGLTFSPTGGANSGGQWQYTGTGAASGFKDAVSQPIPVTPLATYTMSGYVDARAVTTSGVGWFVFDVTVATQYAAVLQPAGSNGRVSATFTMPAGVTQVVVLPDTGNVTVNSGQTLSWSNPQLELGSTASTYQPALPDMSSYVPIDTVPPADPSGVTPTALPGGYASVAWTGSASSDVFSYVVELAQETALLSGVVGSWVGVGVSFAPTVAVQIGGLTPTVVTGLRYQIRVKAIDHSNNASNYATSSLFLAIGASALPTTPTGVALSGNTESDAQTTTAMVSISWSKVTDRDLAYYIVDYFRTDGVGGHTTVQVPAIMTSQTVRALKIGVQYGVVVYSVDVYGNRSDGSTEVDITVATPIPTNHQPGNPTISSVTVAGGASNGIATLTVNFTVGFGGSSSNVSFPADNDLSYVGIRESTTALGANNTVGPQAGTVNVAATAANGATGSFSKTVYRNSDNTDYSLFYKALMVDTGGLISPASTEVSVLVAGYSGGAGDPICPAVEMYLPSGGTVLEAQTGDLFLCLEDNRLTYRELQESRFGTADCVRLWTDNGCSVVVSETTPMVLEDGTEVKAPAMEGRKAATWICGRLEWSTCHVESAGRRRVRFVCLGGAVFAAGAVPNRCIFTHNTLPRK